MKQNLNIVIIIGLVLLILILCFFPISRKEGFESKGEEKVFVINLPKDKQRFQEFKDYYDKSDMKHHPLHTFTAVIGKDVDSEEVLAEHAKPDFKRVVQTGKRQKHHELSHGGLGCFLSHYNVAKQFTEEQDPAIQQYIVFEDDNVCTQDTQKKIKEAIKKLPDNWDILIGQTWRQTGDKISSDIQKPKSFWGTGLVVYNKKGAQRFVDEVNKTKIDGQVDAYLSRANQQGKLNIYSTNENLVEDNSHNMSNIQLQLEGNGTDVFDYYGTSLE